MASVTEEMPKSCVREIVRVSSPDRVLLFGSQATGAASEGSDIDLLVIGPPSDLGRWSRVAEIGKIRRNLPVLGIPFDILFYTPEEAERRRGWNNHVVADAFRTGRILYERP